ncbi:HlyD family secretion protein [bacterium]|nr:HlyD family secretion protein [bacterium]
MTERLLVLLLILIPLNSGCTSGDKVKGAVLPSFHYSYGSRSSQVTFTGIVQASQSYEISLKEGCWGLVKWIATEGTIVASGDKIASIDMSAWEEQLEYNEMELRHSKEAATGFDSQTPFVLGGFSTDFKSKERDLLLKKGELEWLRDGKLLDERLRVLTDHEKAKREIDFARKILSFQKEIVERGFDSPFSRREREIELAAKEIEMDYSAMRIRRMNTGPLEDEIAKAMHAIAVASGERWLADIQKISGATSREIERKSLDFSVECNSSQVRINSERLDQREIFSKFSGLVIYPTFWGGQKVAPGEEVWEGLSFMKIVATGSILLDAAVDETVSSLFQPGATASIRLDIYQEIALPGKVLSVGKVPRRKMVRVPTEFKKFPVQVGVEAGSLPVRLGIKGEVTVFLAKSDGVFIPRDLVRDEGGSSTVRILNSFGNVSSLSAIVEPFDSDTVRWMNPPASSGLLLY